MERVRPLTVAAALVVALAGTGCVTVDPTAKTVQLSVAPAAPPPPATQLECMWQRRLTPLADPVRDGLKQYGLPGQMFLYTSDGTPAEIAGNLTVYVYDETPRTNGMPPHRPEAWEFTQDVLKRLATNDERFGRTFALFLPWPPHWKDVTQIRVAPRYDGQDKATKLVANETRLTLDTRSPDVPVWSQVGAGQPGMGAPTQPPMTGYDQFGAPDPARLRQQANGPALAPAYPQPNVQPAGALAPPGSSPWPGGMQAPPGGIQAPSQPLAAPQPPPGMPQPIPIPPRTW